MWPLTAEELKKDEAIFPFEISDLSMRLSTASHSEHMTRNQTTGNYERDDPKFLHEINVIWWVEEMNIQDSTNNLQTMDGK